MANVGNKKSAGKNGKSEVFCVNCGSRINGRTKFCAECGYPTGSSAIRVNFEKVDKCPNCGDNIPSFTAKCPSCGAEISSDDIPPAIKEFSGNINKLDNAIAAGLQKLQKGWNSWTPTVKILWVILNVIFVCIPLIFYFLYQFYCFIKPAPFTLEEEKKAHYINNFTFPNDRENILEGLLYIKSAMAALGAKKIDRNTSRWVKIWKNKATDLFEKAEIMFKGDKIARDAYAAILKSEKKLKKTLLIKIIISSAVLVIFVLYMSFKDTFDTYEYRRTDTTTTFTWPASGLALELPEPPTNIGEIELNSDRELWVEMRAVEQAQFENYIEECKNKGFAVDVEKSNYSYKAHNEKGYCLNLYYYTSYKELSLSIEAPLPLSDIKWPKSDIAKLLPVPKSTYAYIESESPTNFVIFVGETTKEDFREYAEACYEAGFKKDYSKYDTSFSGYDEEGNYLDLQYIGNKIMSIRVYKKS